MKRRIFVILVMLSTAVSLSAQQEESAISGLVGADMSEVDEYEVERLTELLRRPLCLNLASESELLSSGLFSRYQVASLLDYRSRSGPVLSYLELEAVDGFGADLVTKVRPFVSLERVAVSSGSRTDHDVTARLSLRNSEGDSRWGLALRYRIESGERLSGSLAVSRSLDATGVRPDAFCASLAWRFSKLPMKLIIGDFNARFGQGLSLWNGFVMSLNTPSSFMRRPSGLLPSSSMTGSLAHTGVASELNIGRISVSMMLAAPGIKQIRVSHRSVQLVPAINITYNGARSQFGLTHYTEFSGLIGESQSHIPVMKSSADFSICLQGVNIFSEICYDWVERETAILCGAIVPVGDAVEVASRLLADSSEYALALGGSLVRGEWMNFRDASRRRVSGHFSADATLYPEPKTDTQDRSLQCRVHTQWEYLFSESILLTFRFVERFRSWGTRFRTDFRTDVAWHSGAFDMNVRLNALVGKRFSWLGFLEGGFRAGRLSLYLRQGVFCIDNWDDRIYVYERDAPGCFNVPAYYGRGLWTSALLSWKTLRWGKVYLRGAYTAYPFMKEEKPGKAELRLQYVLDF